MLGRLVCWLKSLAGRPSAEHTESVPEPVRCAPVEVLAPLAGDDPVERAKLLVRLAALAVKASTRSEEALEERDRASLTALVSLARSEALEAGMGFGEWTEAAFEGEVLLDGEDRRATAELLVALDLVISGLKDTEDVPAGRSADVAAGPDLEDHSLGPLARVGCALVGADRWPELIAVRRAAAQWEPWQALRRDVLWERLFMTDDDPDPSTGGLMPLAERAARRRAASGDHPLPIGTFVAHA